jgi:hypothetical protein
MEDCSREERAGGSGGGDEEVVEIASTIVVMPQCALSFQRDKEGFSCSEPAARPISVSPARWKKAGGAQIGLSPFLVPYQPT